MTAIVTKRSLTREERTVEDLRWKKFPVLSDGFVCLVDVMGDDSSVVQAARVSYGKDVRAEERSDKHIKKLKSLFGEREIVPGPGAGVYGCYNEVEHKWARESIVEDQKKDDRNLIRYMMRHNHGTPFEMCELKLLIRMPMDSWRQMIRHRTANVNEYSTRYTEAIDSMDKTPPDQWRLQSGTNKQGSLGRLEEWPKEIKPYGESLISAGKYLSMQEADFHDRAQRIYQERLKFGVAREQARKDLPLSNFTEAYWKCDLRNVLHFLGLRMDSHAQLEIRQYATIIGEQIVKPLFPMVWEAFEDYRLGAMSLTRLDIETIRKCLSWYEKFTKIEADSQYWPEEWRTEKSRERDECIEKLKKLGLVEE